MLLLSCLVACKWCVRTCNTQSEWGVLRCCGVEVSGNVVRLILTVFAEKGWEGRAEDALFDSPEPVTSVGRIVEI